MAHATSPHEARDAGAQAGDAGGAGTGVNEPRIAVLSASWTQAPQSESAEAVRSIAGALSRLAPVDVFVPGGGATFADGAFDVSPIPGAHDPRARYQAVVVEAGHHGADELARSAASLAAGGPVLAVGGARFAVDGVLDVGLGDPAGTDGPRTGPAVHHVGLYARVHPGARGRRHYGLSGIPDYLLVLGDRPGVPVTPTPSDRTRWLLARFARRHLVVVEGGVARAWRSRSCVAQFDVHTRMDLWILMAQAQGVVDLLPGDVYARECVEALRLGVPIVAPGGSAADRLARAAGDMRFTSTAELLSCAEALGDPAVRESLSSAGREVADRWYGDPHALVARLAGVLGLADGVDGRRGGTTGPLSRPTTAPGEGTTERSPSSRG